MILPTLLAALYGVVLKMADLFNEHGMKWFRRDAIVFGVLWGVVAVFLMLSHPMGAVFIMACLGSYLLRFKLDYLNHSIAGGIIVIAIALFGVKIDNVAVFLGYLLANTLGGIPRDYYGNRHKKKDVLFYFFEYFGNWYWYVIPGILALIFKDPIIFFIPAAETTMYALVKFGFFKAGLYTQLHD